jgi:hypothetical protein
MPALPARSAGGDYAPHPTTTLGEKNKGLFIFNWRQKD